ncbi:MAG: ABC transporter permease, partial [Sphaerochaeta sp.]
MSEKIEKKEAPLNEFNQVVVGNSLTKDAWRRLKKNKMAVLGMVIVIVYSLLAAFATLLPIYPYDEIILDHQHLRPTWNKTAGDLMMESKLEDLYFKAWRSGSLVVTEAQSAQIKKWITDNESNKVWNFCLIEGERQKVAGTFTFSDADVRTIERLQKNIDTEFFISVQKIYWKDMETGKTQNLAKMSYKELLPVYSALTNMDIPAIEAMVLQNIRDQAMNTIKNSNPGLSQEEYQSSLDMEMMGLEEKSLASTGKTNLMGRIKTTITRTSESNLKQEIKDGTVTFPIDKEITISKNLSADIQASKKHSRHYLLGTDYSGRDMLSRIIYGGQVSIMIGLIGTLTSVFIGIIVGALAGYLGGKVDFFLMRLVDIMYGLPYM